MKKLFVFISIILGYAGFFFIFLFINNQLSEQNYPEAKQGIINLETWDFQKDGNIALTGEWALYRNQLLSPKDIHAGKGKAPIYSDVPNNVKLTDSGKNVDYGTYRLMIRSKQDNEMFGISTSFINSANRVYFYGKLIGQSGTPSNKANFTAQNKPYTSFFEVRRGDNELIVQFSNFKKTPSWGIEKPIAFGMQQHILHQSKISFLNETSMITAFFITGLYFLGFFLHRRKDKHLFFFSTMCLLFSVIVRKRTNDLSSLSVYLILSFKRREGDHNGACQYGGFSLSIFRLQRNRFEKMDNRRDCIFCTGFDD
ncbi:hypothetical protein [Bacillus licheniformis]|uniref:hypothetical protein n=1 Tax=Bacillus licheniformis TaxID=1402 RepID=UPI0016450CD9|nr:hypothetical protein [Bacillus licheniformis]MCA1183095.1 hypothetical protein [Bacillus licheniformis]MCM3212382.1 hypothetical protein [Bacillus licheniformis]MCM3287599.1 hypothetical protein [Bacillus licheniformis]MCY7742051.1 hypothetical protein [Bacillus licheniformis]